MNKDNIGLDLKSICTDFISFMDSLKEKSIISEEEHKSYTSKKIEFINQINNENPFF